MDRINPVDPTVYATDMLTKALHLEPNLVLKLCNEVSDGTELSDKDVKRIQKQVFEVIRIRNNLAIMLDRTDVLDPRQFDLFSDGSDIKPSDFGTV